VRQQGVSVGLGGGANCAPTCPAAPALVSTTTGCLRIGSRNRRPGLLVGRVHDVVDAAGRERVVMVMA
jgi:hypothetical protein